jgi:lipoprotein-anchoring transpeptidase ErfK/SrfK
LDAVARPKLVCSGEWANPPKPAGVGLGNEEVIVIPPPAGAVLPPGPNNPAGLFWVNLAKGTDPTPLPYGLHGTSIPGHLTRQESVGGFRLTNWDLARVVRLLPVGTELKWE